jgi:hypothetical protein
VIRPEHVATVDEELRPILRPTALDFSDQGLPSGAKSQHDDFGDSGLAKRHLFGPIVVEVAAG